MYLAVVDLGRNPRGQELRSPGVKIQGVSGTWTSQESGAGAGCQEI